ncbi:unnamed protein product [Nippostrongylus brasiliensis]|uniref:Uncharacterized protein n=1 Tax=Nippostrongylus brasiliensis TaxID=27835 RepID=A0A0N4YSE7_NIPBR|nr:unnamed protein product [Nippostrongylus brasiliensis]
MDQSWTLKDVLEGGFQHTNYASHQKILISKSAWVEIITGFGIGIVVLTILRHHVGLHRGYYYLINIFKLFSNSESVVTCNSTYVKDDVVTMAIYVIVIFNFPFSKSLDVMGLVAAYSNPKVIFQAEIAWIAFVFNYLSCFLSVLTVVVMIYLMHDASPGSLTSFSVNKQGLAFSAATIPEFFAATQNVFASIVVPYFVGAYIINWSHSFGKHDLEVDMVALHGQHEGFWKLFNVQNLLPAYNYCFFVTLVR